MQNIPAPNEDESHVPAQNGNEFRIVNPSRGSAWLKDAYQIFKLSKGTWFGIGAFLMVASLVPILSMFIVVLMPLLVGGLMIGCSQISASTPIKFDFLFSGLRKHSRQLIFLSLVNITSILVAMALTSNISTALGFDLSLLIPEGMENAKSQELIAWLQKIDPVIFVQTFLVGMLIFLLLMLPVFMAFWFAPALVCLNNRPAFYSLKQSFRASVKNKMAFLVYGGVAITYLFLFFFLLTLIAAVAQPLTLPLMLTGYVVGFSISLISIHTSFKDIFPDHTNEQKIKNSDGSLSDREKENDSMLA